MSSPRIYDIMASYKEAEVMHMAENIPIDNTDTRRTPEQSRDTGQGTVYGDIAESEEQIRSGRVKDARTALADTKERYKL